MFFDYGKNNRIDHISYNTFLNNVVPSYSMLLLKHHRLLANIVYGIKFKLIKFCKKIKPEKFK
jgi:hypothetical protein